MEAKHARNEELRHVMPEIEELADNLPYNTDGKSLVLGRFVPRLTAASFDRSAV